MARINHGTLLQHAVEAQVATALAPDGQGLYLVSTHAMAPYEAARGPEVHAHNRVLRDLLGTTACLAPAAAAAAVHPVVKAYVRTSATVAHYPNTAELLAALVGREKVRGVLCEVQPAHVAALTKAWADTGVTVEGQSWRDALPALQPPAGLTTPWLFTMDPYTWKHGGDCKQAELGPFLETRDLERMRLTLTGYVRSGQPGAFLAFVYGLGASHAGGFRRAILQFADRLGLARAIVGVAAPDGGRHLGAVLSTEPDLPAATAEAWHGLKTELGLR